MLLLMSPHMHACHDKIEVPTAGFTAHAAAFARAACTKYMWHHQIWVQTAACAAAYVIK